MPNPTDRERLAKMLQDHVYVGTAWKDCADKLLAAGVTLPPAPKPALVTAEMLRDYSVQTSSTHCYGYSLADANRLVEAAIRKVVAEKATRRRGWEGDAVVLEGTNVLGEDESEWFLPVGVLLELFGLDL